MIKFGKPEIKHAIISNEKELTDFCGFDEDLNGNNGEEYTMEEALEAGFNNSAEYIVSVAKKQTDNLKDMIDMAISMVCDTDSSYVNYSTVDLGDGRFLAIIVTY